MSDQFSHDDFIKLLKQKQISVHANLSASMHVCDRNPQIPKSKKFAHQFWKFTAMGFLIGGFISFFYIKWFYALGIIFFGMFLARATQQSAAEFVIETTLQDANFLLSND